MRKITISLIGLLLCAVAATAQESSELVVSTKNGKVSGIVQEGTMAWLGIPYAKVKRLMPPLL